MGVGSWRLAGQRQLAGEKRAMGQLVMVFWERGNVVFVGLKGLHAIIGYHVSLERQGGKLNHLKRLSLLLMIFL